MGNHSKILFWFREDLDILRNKAFHDALMLSSELIPVFCFDVREQHLMHPLTGSQTDYFSNLILKVSHLRNELLKRGSNLMVVHDRYERIIPSLARVLGVHQVRTENFSPEYRGENVEISRFRNLKTLEIRKLLNMHSIPVVVDSSFCNRILLPTTFPDFPDVNPGEIPNHFDSHINNHEEQRRRSS